MACLQSPTADGIHADATANGDADSFTVATDSTPVTLMRRILPTLTVSAAAAALTVTATVQAATTRTSAAVTVTVALPSYPDGSANATPGKPELPDLFSGDAVRPPWRVAGVDYYVGAPTGLTLKTPSPATMPAGATLDRQTVYITGNNVTISGFDFSGKGGYGIYVSSGVSGTKITRNHFVDSLPTSPVAVQIEPGASNTYIAHNTINGGGDRGNTSSGETIYNMGMGLTVEYNCIEDVPQHFVSTNGGELVYKFNLLKNGAMAPGSHLNFLQYGSGDSYNNIVEFNTLVQAKTLGGAGEGIQEVNNSAGSITNANVSFNTMVSQDVGLQSGPRGPAVSYWLHLGTTHGYPWPASGVASHNYIGMRSAYGAIYPGQSGFAYHDNIDLTTGRTIPGT